MGGASAGSAPRQGETTMWAAASSRDTNYDLAKGATIEMIVSR
jgi:hypothetical protein